MKNSKPQLILRPTGVPKQFYIDNGFYQNNFYLKNVYQPYNYCHVPAYSSHNRFTFEAPTFLPMYQPKPMKPMESAYFSSQEQIADKYINEARTFAYKQLMELQQFKTEVLSQERLQQTVGGTNYQSKTKDLLQDGVVYQLDEKYQTIKQKCGVDDRYQQFSGVIGQNCRNYEVLNEQKQMDQKIDRQALAERQPTLNAGYSEYAMHSEVTRHSNPYYEPSQPVPDYIKDLTAQYYNGALMLEEAHQKQLRLSETAHFASILQAERNMNQYLENGSANTIDGLLDRICSLEAEVLGSKRFQEKSRMVDELLQQKAEEIRKASVSGQQTVKYQERPVVSTNQPQNQLLVQYNLSLVKQLQQMYDKMATYQRYIDYIAKMYQKENSNTQTKDLSDESSSQPASPLPATPAYPPAQQPRHVKKTPLQRQNSAQDMKNISPYNLLVAPTVQLVKQLTAQQTLDRSLSEKVSKSISPPIKTPPALPPRKAKIAADILRNSVTIDLTKKLSGETNSKFYSAVSSLIEAKKQDILVGMQKSLDTGDSLQIEISDDTITANRTWQDQSKDALKATIKAQNSNSSINATDSKLPNAEDDFDLDIEL